MNDNINDLQNTERLGTEPINKLLLEFSWPAIMGFVSVALYEVVDRIFVGQFDGNLGLTVMAIGMPVVIVINAICIMLRAGVAAVFSHTLGSGNYEDVNKMVSNIFLFAVLIALGLMILVSGFTKQIVVLCAATPEFVAESMLYIRILALGSIGLFIGNVANVLMRALGNPQKGMRIIVGSVILNTIFTAFFVVVMGQGVIGAAYGTMLAQIITGVYGLYHLRFYIKPRAFIPDWSVMNKCFFLGIPLASFELNYMFCAVVLNNLIIYYGSALDLATVPVFSSVMNILFMPIAGLDEGAQVLIGYNYAANNLNRVRQIIKNVILIGLVFYTCSFVIVQVFAEQIVMVFDDNSPEFINHAARTCRIVLAVAPIMAIMHIVPGILTALGEARYNFTLSVVLEIVAQYPPLLILPMFWGVDGIFAAFPVYDLIFAAAAIILLYKSMKRKAII